MSFFLLFTFQFQFPIQIFFFKFQTPFFKKTLTLYNNRARAAVKYYIKIQRGLSPISTRYYVLTKNVFWT
jgi:hypothetical protein